MNYEKTLSSRALLFVPALIVTGLIAAVPVSAQSFTLRLTFDDPTVTDRDRFARSLALAGNRILIGAPFDDMKGDNVGQAHLFDATHGTLLRTYDDPTVTQTDLFGEAVALDVNRVLIGDYADDTNGGNVGRAHLFDPWNLSQSFDDPTVTQGDFMGGAVALDGDRVLIGAYGDDTNGDHVGQAHLFNATTGDLLQTFNDPTVTLGDRFGRSVALSGNRVLVGAPLDNTNGLNVGQAHLFEATSGNLIKTFDDPTPTFQDFFGFAVALDGNRVLIGAKGDGTNAVGQAHLFNATTGDLLQTFNDPTVTVADGFGDSVALDGNRILIGACGDRTNGRNVGQAHLFNATTGDLLQTFDDPTITREDRFGCSVALDGNRILIGAPGDDTKGTDVGQAYLFTPSCDFDVDGHCNIDDLDLMLAEGPIAPGVPVVEDVNDVYDINGDDVIDLLDRDDWLAEAATLNGFASPYKLGDANLDGFVDGVDFIEWTANRFTTGLSWAKGEYNGDGFIDALDFIEWNGNKFTSSDIATVPEPRSIALTLLGLVFVSPSMMLAGSSSSSRSWHAVGKSLPFCATKLS